MTVRVTFDKAKEVYESLHPDHKLVEFESINLPCAILCPEYGLISGLRYDSLKRSTFGCPMCARDKRSSSKRKNQESGAALDPDTLILGSPKSVSKLTTESAVKRFEAKFPNLKLVNFSEAKYPCSVYCPKHGLSHNLDYQTLIKSKYGCPKCAKEHHKKKGEDLSFLYHIFKDTFNKVEASGQIPKKKVSSIKNNSNKFKAALVKVIRDTLFEGLKYPDDILDDSKFEEEFVANSAKDRNLDKSTKENGHLQTDGSEKSKFIEVYEDIFVRVPFFKNIRAASGITGSVEDTNQIFLPISRGELLQVGVRRVDVICSRVQGDSMEPILQNGALVAIDTSKVEIENGSIYAFVNENGMSCINTLLKVGNDELKIHSYNSKYKTETVKSDSIKIVGKVFWSSAFL